MQSIWFDDEPRRAPPPPAAVLPVVVGTPTPRKLLLRWTHRAGPRRIARDSIAHPFAQYTGAIATQSVEMGAWLPPSVLLPFNVLHTGHVDAQLLEKLATLFPAAELERVGVVAGSAATGSSHGRHLKNMSLLSAVSAQLVFTHESRDTRATSTVLRGPLPVKQTQPRSPTEELLALLAKIEEAYRQQVMEKAQSSSASSACGASSADDPRALVHTIPSQQPLVDWTSKTPDQLAWIMEARAAATPSRALSARHTRSYSDLPLLPFSRSQRCLLIDEHPTKDDLSLPLLPRPLHPTLPVRIAPETEPAPLTDHTLMQLWLGLPQDADDDRLNALADTMISFRAARHVHRCRGARQ